MCANGYTLRLWYGYSAVCGYSFALAAGNWPHVRPRGNALRLPSAAEPLRAASGQIAENDYPIHHPPGVASRPRIGAR